MRTSTAAYEPQVAPTVSQALIPGRRHGSQAAVESDRRRPRSDPAQCAESATVWGERTVKHNDYSTLEAQSRTHFRDGNAEISMSGKALCLHHTPRGCGCSGLSGGRQRMESTRLRLIPQRTGLRESVDGSVPLEPSVCRDVIGCGMKVVAGRCLPLLLTVPAGWRWE